MKVNIELSERQALAFNDPDQFLLYGGAKGGGKSWFLCVWIYTQAIQNPHSKWFFFRKRGVDFTNTTLETWKKAIPSGEYILNPNLKKITMRGSKAVIDFGGLDDESAVEKLNSAEYSGGAIDQAEEIDKDAFAMCRGTLRHKRPICPKHKNECETTCQDREYEYKIRLSANPRQCWLKEDFIMAPKKGHKFVQALPKDNPWLPTVYIENLYESFKHRPEKLKSYLEGSWDAVEGEDVCIKYEHIIKNKTIEPRGPIRKCIVVNDPARTDADENVMYVMCQTDNVAYVKHQEILKNRDGHATAARLAALKIRFDATEIFVDSIGVGTSVIDALGALGQSVTSICASAKPTSGSKHASFHNLRSQMWIEASDLFAQGKCKTHEDVLEAQLSGVSFDYKENGRMLVESKDEIKKRLGHSPDRADAFIMGIYGLSQVNPTSGLEAPEDNEDRVGHGTPVDSFQEQYTVFPDEVFA